MIFSSPGTEDEAEETAPADQSVKAKKKGGRNKSTSFFLSD